MRTMDIKDLKIKTETVKENDSDECNELTTIQDSFPKIYTICAEHESLNKKSYILAIGYRKKPSTSICTAESNTCEVYTLAETQLLKTASLGPHRKNVINVKFGSEYYSVFTATEDVVKMWDLRTSTSVLEFKENGTQEKSKLLLDFDITANNRFLCAGTALSQGDAFLLFWDVRKADLLGAYWDTHSDDITKVNFHPVHNNILATGSIDGLINIFDLNYTTESEALLNSLNTESSVSNLVWYTGNNSDKLCCVTHTEEVQLWDTEEVLRNATFSRSDVTEAIQGKRSDSAYVANVHTQESTDDIFLIAGSYFNNVYYARGLNIRDDKLVPSFTLQGNKQIIRASWYDPQSDVLVTGGEFGILNVWRSENHYENNKMSLKSKSSKTKLHKKGPY